MSEKTAAIVGASADRTKFSNKSVRAHIRQGWRVYPVNPKGGEIEGLRVYPSLRDIPDRMDRVSLYLPPSVGITILEEIASVRPTEFFVNPGAESEELLEAARELGLDPIVACSIVDIGETPGSFSSGV